MLWPQGIIFFAQKSILLLEQKFKTNKMTDLVFLGIGEGDLILYFQNLGIHILVADDQYSKPRPLPPYLYKWFDAEDFSTVLTVTN